MNNSFHNSVRPLIYLSILLFVFSGFQNSFSLDPYTVRTVYFIPTDSDDRSEWLDLDDIMKSNQNVYRSEMNRHGFPNKTFRLELDNQGDVIVHKVFGRHNKAFYYHNTFELVVSEIQQRFNDKKNIYSIVIAGVPALQGGWAGGLGSPRPWNSDEYHGFALSGETSRENTEQVILHELGHTFGLWHIVLYNAKEFILGSGKKLSLHEARWLSKLCYFNNQWNFGTAPSIVKFHKTEQLDNGKIRFSIDIKDNSGIYQAYIWLNTNIVGWNFFNDNNNNDTAIFDVDLGHVLGSNNIWVQLMDNDGNWMYYAQGYALPRQEPTDLDLYRKNFDEKFGNKNYDLKPVDIDDGEQLGNPDLSKQAFDEKFDNKNPEDLDNNNDDVKHVCEGCEVSIEEIPEDDETNLKNPRSVNARNKLTVKWASLKSLNR